VTCAVLLSSLSRRQRILQTAQEASITAMLVRWIVLIAVAAGFAFLGGSVSARPWAESTVWELVQAKCSGGQVQVGMACYDGAGRGDAAKWKVTDHQATYTDYYTTSHTYSLPSRVTASGAALSLTATGTGSSAQVCVKAFGLMIKQSDPCARTGPVNPGQTLSGSATLTLVGGAAAPGTLATVQVIVASNLFFTYKATAAGGSPGGGSSGGTGPAGKVVARLGPFSGDVSIRRAGGAFVDANGGEELREGDDVSTGLDGYATLKLANGSTVTIKPDTQANLASLLRQQNDIRVRVNLKLGQIEAKIAKSQTSIPSFSIRTPNATASVRGTAFSVFYDPGSRATVVSVTQHSVEVDPARPGAATVVVPAGKEVEIVGNAVARLTLIGKANARGGINRVRALELVEKLIALSGKACGLESPRDSSAFAIAPRASGWTVTIRTTAPTTGASTWAVVAGKAAPANALAKRIAAGCP
jgi:hypothetical protein